MEYKKEKELGPDSIQKWCEKMDKLERENFSDNETELFFMCTLGENKINNDPNFKKHFDGWNAISLLNDRIKDFHTYTIDNAAIMFLGSLIDRPGIAVQYANFIQYKCWLFRIKHVTMNELSKKIMPWGKFKMEDLQLMWEKQKYVTDEKYPKLANMLDNGRFMESIRNIVA